MSDNNREEREGPAASYIVYDTNVEVHQKKMSDRKSGIAGKASNIHDKPRHDLLYASASLSRLGIARVNPALGSARFFPYDRPIYYCM